MKLTLAGFSLHLRQTMVISSSQPFSIMNKLSLIHARDGLKKRKFSSVELVKSCLDQIVKHDKKIHAFLHINSEALSQAQKADVTLPLGGIPVAVKDNFLTIGMPTTASSKVLDEYLPHYESTVTQKLIEAGAIILGKTNMDAWAHGSSTETSDFGTTKNPWNTDYLPGGSSGGTASSVAADQTIAGIGSETAGSIRQPAGWCGIVGLKPTYGRVSRYGVVAMASSTDSPGPMTKTVEDSATILNILAGKDDHDATTSTKATPDYTKDLKIPVKGKRIGVSAKYLEGVD